MTFDIILNNAFCYMIEKCVKHIFFLVFSAFLLAFLIDGGIIPEGVPIWGYWAGAVLVFALRYCMLASAYSTREIKPKTDNNYEGPLFTWSDIVMCVKASVIAYIMGYLVYASVASLSVELKYGVTVLAVVVAFYFSCKFPLIEDEE